MLFGWSALLLLQAAASAPPSRSSSHFTLSEQVLAAVAGAIALGLFTLFAALIVGRTLRKYQVRESGARTELSLNVDVSVRVLPVVEGKMDAGVILESRVDVRNNSTRVCCVPAVYVLARALVRSGLERDYFGESDFDNLPACDRLSEVRNVAHFEGTIVQVAPEEIERFVRWDTLDQSFVETFPVVVINVEVFGASAEHLIEDHSGKNVRTGKYRLEWIRLMDSEGGIRHNFQLFARWHPSEPSPKYPFKPNQRILLKPDRQPDVENTSRFKPVVDSVVQWSRHTTVDLRRIEHKIAAQERTSRVGAHDDRH